MKTVAALICLIILTLLCLFFSRAMVHSLSTEGTAVATNRDFMMYPVLITSCLVAVCGAILMIVSFFQKRRWGVKAGYAILLVISVVSICSTLHFLKHHSFKYNKYKCGMMSIRNLVGLLIEYRHENGGAYPPPDQWCDALYQHHKAKDPEHDTDHYFVCPGGEEGRSNFAVNSKANAKSDDDVVWVFDSYPGWNVHGGRELVNCDNHEGKGFNVFFCGGGIQFVEKDKLDELKWE